MAIRKSSNTGIPFGNTAGRPAAQTGQPYFNGEAARLELYTSGGSWENIVQEVPGVSSISGTYLESLNSGTFTIYGTNFVTGAIATAVGSNGVQVNATSTVFNSLVQLTATFTGLSNQHEPYDIKVTNPSNLFGLLPDALYVNAIPVWQTAAGSLGTFEDYVSMSVSAIAIDDSTITYALASGSSLPSGITLNSSTGLISGTTLDVLSDTTYTFTINASDGLNPVVPRTFNFTVNAAPIWSTSSGLLGTFGDLTNISIQLAATDVSDTVTYALASGSSLPFGVTLSSAGLITGTLPNISTDTNYEFTVNASDGINTVSRSFIISSRPSVPIEYLVVAGGGGGSSIIGGGGGGGGVLAGTLSKHKTQTALITVGAGGRGGNGYTSGHSNEAGFPGFNSVFDSITSTGGGGTAGWDSSGTLSYSGEMPWSKNGGSGGGGSGSIGWSTTGQGYPQKTGGTGISGQGNSGGNGNDPYGAGGGGAGAAGGTFSTNGNIAGGAGVASSITGTSTHYGGGGGGGRRLDGGGTGPSNGGIGGGGQGMSGGSFSSSQNGTANTGGGGGGGNYQGPGTSSQAGGNGGSGVVIIAYPNTNPALTNIPGTLTYDQPARSGYRVYRFTGGTGTITF